MKMAKIKLGYEIGSGEPVIIESSHLIVTGLWHKARKRPIIIDFREVTKIEVIKTREGVLKAYPGKDYIIRGVRGEEYPIKKKIFEETYEVLL